MSALQNLLRNAHQAFQFISQLLKYVITFLLALMQPKAVLATRLLAAESQLAVCKHRIQEKKDPHPRFTPGFRVLWVLLSKFLTYWQDSVHLMEPATVKRWHTTAFRLHWRWKSRRKPGRPTIGIEMQGLIRKLSAENPLWSAKRIRDTFAL